MRLPALPPGARRVRPTSAATARLLLGRAHQPGGDAQLAQLEWQAAHRGLRRLRRRTPRGAGRWLLAGATPSRGPSRRGGRRCVAPGRHGAWVTAVVSWCSGISWDSAISRGWWPSRGASSTSWTCAVHSASSRGCRSSTTRPAPPYRRRLAEVEDDIAQAEEDLDDTRRAHAEQDRDYLVAELRRAVGLGGRDRTTSGTSERARTSVTRSLRYALARIGEQEAELGAHLGRRVRTGLYCRYEPDPVANLTWDVATTPESPPDR